MNETLQNLVNRKSCRSFQPGHLTAGQIDTLLAAGLNAPTGRNLQTTRFVVVQNEEVVAQLSKMNAAVMGAPIDPFYGAKDVIIVLTKKEGTYVYDGALAMGNLLNAAYAMGLGACWIHRAKEVFASDEGKTLLAAWGITEEVEGIGFCILGQVREEKPKTEIQPNRIFRV